MELLLLILALLGALLLLTSKTTKAPPQVIYIYTEAQPVRSRASLLWLLVAAVLLLLALVQ